MPTLGFLKKKRTKDSSGREVESPTSPAKDSLAPVTPTSSKGTVDALTKTTSTPQSAASKEQPLSRAKTTETMPPAGAHKQNGSGNYQHQNAPSMQSFVSPSQHDGAQQSHLPVQAPLVNKGLALSDGGAITPSPTPQPARTTKGKYTLSDFTMQRTLGTGSFGRVHLVQSKHNQRFYAVKVLKKAQVVKMKQVEHTNDERRMLQKVKHPFLITLWGTFQDAKNLYMVMDFVEGGELFSLLRKSQVSVACHPQLPPSDPLGIPGLVGLIPPVSAFPTRSRSSTQPKSHLPWTISTLRTSSTVI